VQPIVAPVHGDTEIEQTINSLGHHGDGGLIVAPDIFLLVRRALIVTLTARNNVPAVYPLDDWARDGGLMSYGSDYLDIFRRAAPIVHSILLGEKPSELPVQIPTKFQLVINLKTAKALGLDIPTTLLARADEVIY
jgi:putative ABC transport system substrate-binding protein